MAIPLMADVAICSNAIPAVVGIGKFRRINTSMRILTILTILTCVQEVAEYIVGGLKGNNYVLFVYFRIVEVSLLCAVFFFSISTKIGRRHLFTLGAIFAVIWLIHLLFFNDSTQISSGMAMIARAFLIAMSVVALWWQTKDERMAMLESSLFWVAAGVIIYACGTLVVLGLSNFLLALGRPYFVVAWYINWCLLIASNIFYTKGLLCKVQA